jgi:hypothetical protein
VPPSTTTPLPTTTPTLHLGHVHAAVRIDVRGRRHHSHLQRDRRRRQQGRRVLHVHVRGASEQIDDLQHLLVVVTDIPTSVRQSLNVKLIDAETTLANANRRARVTT